MNPAIHRLRTVLMAWARPSGNLLGLVGFLVVAGGGFICVSGIRAHLERQHEQKVRAVARSFAGELEHAITRASSLTLLLAAQVEKGQGKMDGFSHLADVLVPNFPGVSAVGLAPQGIIEQIEPRGPNQRAIGHDLMGDQQQALEAIKTRDSKVLTLAGPMNLVQGGEGVVARYPVFFETGSNERRFWGFTFAVIRVPELVAQSAALFVAETGHDYELWRRNPLTNRRQRISGVNLDGRPTSDVPIELPNTGWTLSVERQRGPVAWWMATYAAVILFAALLGLVTKLLFDLSLQRRRLAEEVTRRTAESRYRETLFSKLFHTSSVMLTLTKVEDGAFLEFNESFLSRTGFTREDLQGQTTTSVGLLRADERREFVERLRKEQRLFRSDVVICGKGGEAIHVQYHAELVSFGGQTCIITTWMDLTQQRVADETLRLQITALEAAANAIIVANRDGRIVWANAASSAQTGYDFGEMFGRKPGALFRSGVHDAAFYQQMRAALDAGKVWQAEMTNRRRDGSLIVENVTITPVKDLSGEITHYIAVKQDVTERRALEEQVRRAQRLEAVGLLAGGVAHDFNNILAAVLMTLEICEAEGEVGPAPRALLRDLRKNVQRGASLTRQLLTFSRQEAMEVRRVEINALVADLLTMLRRLIPANIQIVTELAEHLPACRGDAGMIEQVVTNLCVNARDAMPDGGRITLATWSEEAVGAGDGRRDGSYVAISVRDSGCGIDEATVAKIFDPFFTTKPVGKGTGLGLSTVYGIVRQHGGAIRVASEVGKGSSFDVTIPVWTEAKADESPADDGPDGGSDGGGGRILLVEDDEIVRRVMATSLRKSGYEVVEAPDAVAALQEGERTEFAAVVTDVMMPGGVTGPELLVRLRARRPRLPGVICSGYGTDIAGRGPVPDDRTVFLRKPFPASALTQSLGAVLSGNRAGADDGARRI